MKRNSKHLKTLRDRGFGRAAIRCTDPRPVHLAQGVTRFRDPAERGRALPPFPGYLVQPPNPALPVNFAYVRNIPLLTSGTAVQVVPLLLTDAVRPLVASLV